MQIKITKNKEEANLITHNNKFHPDDVFSTVFLSKYIDNPVLYRTNVGEVDAPNAIVYDVGFGKFDHHGVDAKYRPNSKLKYCSFGLLWTEYGKDYLSKNNYEYVEELYSAIEEKLVKQIDGIDNGIFPEIKAEYSLLDLDHIIDLFNPTWEEKEVDTDEYFLRALNTAEIIFDENDKLSLTQDPKILAAKNMDIFPVEINRAPLVELIRVPGIGVKSAREIISIRKKMPFTSEQQLKKLGVVVERAKPYIKIDGEYQTTFDF